MQELRRSASRVELAEQVELREQKEKRGPLKESAPALRIALSDSLKLGFRTYPTRTKFTLLESLTRPRRGQHSAAVLLCQASAMSRAFLLSGTRFN